MNARLVWLVILSSLTAWHVSAQPESALEEESDFYADGPAVQLNVREALENNPTIREAFARYRAALQRVPQVTALPDPMVNFTQFVRSVETRVGPQLNAVTLTQKFPWFGRLDAKGKTVFKEAASQYEMYRAQRREIINQTKQAVYELSYIDRALAIANEESDLLQHYERLAESRYSAGQGLQQAVIKIQAEITKVINRVKILNQQRESRVARLNTLQDKPPQTPVPAIEDFAPPSVKLNLRELYELGEKNRQELKAAGALIERDEKAIELAKKDFRPDFTLSAGVINVGDRSDLAGVVMPPQDNGKTALSFSVGLNLPIWKDKYQAGVLEATESLLADRERYLNLRNEMQFSIRDQLVRLETLRDQIDLFDRILIPQAAEALRSTESAYQTGQLGALELLDSERVLLDLRLVRERYRADYLAALSNLERAVGTKFPNQ